MSEQLAVAQQKLNTLRSMLEQASPRLSEVAPKHLSVERLTRLLLSAASRNPKILECTKESVLNFAMTCSQTGLEPIGAGGIHPIPYANKKAGTVELTAIVDYRGMANVAKRAECIKDAYAEVVYEKDEFDYELGLNPILKHKPGRGDRGALESAYCIIVMPDDVKRFVVMDKKEIESIRDRSNAWRTYKTYGKECPWNTDPAEMWKKTVMRRGMKPFAGAAPEMDAVIELDDKVTGAIDVTPRAPIPEPKALPETDTPAPASVATPAPVAPEPPPEGKDSQKPSERLELAPIEIPEGCEVSEGILTDIRPVSLKRKEDAKDGSYKKGDGYFKHDFIMDSDDFKYSTFSESLAEEGAKFIGKGVRLVWKASGAYRNAVSVHPVA